MPRPIEWAFGAYGPEDMFVRRCAEESGGRKKRVPFATVGNVPVSMGPMMAGKHAEGVILRERGWTRVRPLPQLAQMQFHGIRPAKDSAAPLGAVRKAPEIQQAALCRIACVCCMEAFAFALLWCRRLKPYVAKG